VIGLSVTLAERSDELGPGEIKFLAERLAHNATRLDRLLSDLLDLDRITRGILEPRRRPTAMTILVNEAIAAVRNGTHEIDLSGVDDVTADIDPAMTERIVENLVANAMKHTPEGSHVWVRVTPADGGILVAVEDDGPGVPAHARAVIFEPFRQGAEPRNATSGAGIGLSLVAQFAKLHGGRAWVEGREGGGAAFRVLLPSTVGASQLSAS
jgi:signal transduction histidine kinase